MPTALPNFEFSTLADAGACLHCGLPVGPRPVERSGVVFCCTGCAVVYETLQASGLGETYYRLREAGAPAPAGALRPAAEVDALQLDELDSGRFVEAHTRPAGEGLREAELFVDGVHCAACVWLVERLPFEVAGVVDARLDLPRARLTLRFRPEVARLSEVAQWLSRFGYAAHAARGQAQGQRSQAEQRLLLRLGVAWALAGNVMLLAFAFYAGLDLTTDPALATVARWTSLLLATASVAYGGSVFLQRAWASLRLAWRARRLASLHLDTPIALGILVGYGHSAWATLSGQGEVWFDSITVLIAALLTARWLQLRSRRLAGDATERLLTLIPHVVRRVGRDGTEAVPVSDVEAGDLVEVRPGDVIPVDGVVAEGRSSVDKAVLTGESRPEPLGPGTHVEAGATNLSATIRVRVEAAGEATRVGRLLAWVRDAQARRAPVVLLADRLSGVFVVSVLALAVLTVLFWLPRAPGEVVPHLVALLVITCPCALGMATPLAFAVAAGRAARAGIFIKSGAATQQLARVDAFVLDKTGTVTEGRLRLVGVEGDAEALRWAAALEAESTHPVALALQQAFPAEVPRAEACQTVPGQGIRGWVENHDVLVGRPAWVASATRGLAAELDAARQAYAEAGHTPVALAVDGQAVAMLAFGDRLRAEAAGLVERLQASGKAVYLCSGDHPGVVRHVARALGLPEERARGGVSPEAKRTFVEALQREGRTVAMVGDGVNDAAALQAADVGVAVAGGSTPSLVAADLFLTGEGLGPVTAAYDGARHTMRVVRRNLGVSLVYNVVGAAAAFAGLVTPLVAAVAMPLSSLAVVASSILQRSFSDVS